MIEANFRERCDRCKRIIREGVDAGGETAPVRREMLGPGGERLAFRYLCPSCLKTLVGVWDRFRMAPKKVKGPMTLSDAATAIVADLAKPKREQFPERVKREIAEEQAAEGGE